jgi:amino acid transporter
MIGGLWMRGRRRWTVACAMIAALAAVLSLGPLVPYDWLVNWYPGFAQVRNVFRFAVFVQLLVVFLACGGLVVFADLAQWLARRFVLRSAPLSVWRNRVNGILPATLVALVGAACVFEIRPPDRALYAVPSLDDNRGWIAWLRDETRPDDVIAAAPFSPGGHVAYYQQTTVWMYWGTFHGRQMVNGYSGFHPEQHVELQWAMAWFPDDRSLRMLRDRGVAYCVVRRERPGTPLAERMRNPPPELVPVFHDDRAGVDIYRLQIDSTPRQTN